MDAIERIEVAVRSALTDHMSLTHGDPFWYLNKASFKDAAKHDKFIEMVRVECRKQLERAAEISTDEFAHSSALEHYMTTYGDPDLPPSWLMVEQLTLGQLEQLVANLRHPRDVEAVARSLGLRAPLLLSWLRTYVRVRNICAHHGRLWNVGLGVYPALPNSASVQWVNPAVFADEPWRSKRLYPVLISLQSMMSTISPGSSWSARFATLLDHHSDVPLRGMGIPQGWRDDPLWATTYTE